MNKSRTTKTDVAHAASPPRANPASLPEYGPDSWSRQAAETQNAIRAPKESSSARIKIIPVPISELGPAQPPSWVWPGYVARGHVTLFTGLWKAGKSTLTGHLLHDLDVGGGLVGEGISGIKSLVISEESAGIWSNRRDDLSLTDNVHIVARPLMQRATMPVWQDIVEQITVLVGEQKYGMVIFDTLANLWPVRDENNASEVGEALTVLNGLLTTDVAVMLVHHPRKGGGDEGQATRGSGALPGFADVILEFGRYAKDDPDDRRRVLRAYSRFESTPVESVIELGPEGYRVLGDKREVGQDQMIQTIKGMLPLEGEGYTSDQVLDTWPRSIKPAKRSVDNALQRGAERGEWQRLGTGRKNSPYRYVGTPFDSRNTHSLGARNESGTPNTPVQAGKEGSR